MKKSVVLFTTAILAVMMVLSGCQKNQDVLTGDVKITLWTQESQSEGSFQLIEKFIADFQKDNPKITVEVVQKDTEALREDFQTASLAGNAPELLWTVSDHAGPFVTADIIQNVDGLVNPADYVPSVVVNGKTFAVPITSGNHLMLMYNTDFVKAVPKDTDELIAMSKALQPGMAFPFVFNQTEPFWFVPWLGAFDGKVFAADGVTPTLNTPAMVSALKFVYDLKYTHKIIPSECDYNAADTLFKEGKAAFIINGDWSISDYQKVLGAKFAVAPIPKVTATGKSPAPYTAGKYFMVSKDVKGDKLIAVKKFIAFSTSYEREVEIVTTLKRLPGLKKALSDSAVTSDATFKASSEQMALGTPMPTVLEMRANWDAMKPELIKVLSGTTTPEAAAAAMQPSAEAAIKAMK